ncbi:MAG: hypothetical protein AABY22_12935 [Nanoarchaeota archaeon]
MNFIEKLKEFKANWYTTRLIKQKEKWDRLVYSTRCYFLQMSQAPNTIEIITYRFTAEDRALMHYEDIQILLKEIFTIECERFFDIEMNEDYTVMSITLSNLQTLINIVINTSEMQNTIPIFVNNATDVKIQSTKTTIPILKLNSEEGMLTLKKRKNEYDTLVKLFIENSIVKTTTVESTLSVEYLLLRWTYFLCNNNENKQPLTNLNYSKFLFTFREQMCIPYDVEYLNIKEYTGFQLKPLIVSEF